MSPFYQRLPVVPGFANDVTADQVGLGLLGAVTGLTAVHAGASYVRSRRQRNQVVAASVATPAAAATALDEPEPPAAEEGGEQ
jgi:hydrogenase small subunit